MDRLGVIRDTWAAVKRDLLHCACGTRYFMKGRTGKHAFVLALLTTDFQVALWYRIYRMFYLLGLRKFGLLIYLFARFLYKCDIHPQAEIGPGLLLMHGFGIVIGPDAVVGIDVVIFNGVNIGKKHVGAIGGKMPAIHDRSVIGTGAKLLGDIQIGPDAMVGANSVVIRDIPPCAVAAGNPARIVKQATP